MTDTITKILDKYIVLESGEKIHETKFNKKMALLPYNEAATAIQAEMVRGQLDILERIGLYTSNDGFELKVSHSDGTLVSRQERIAELEAELKQLEGK